MSRPRSSRWPPRLTAAGIRNLVLFVGGSAGMVYEAGFVTEPRAILVGAYLLLMGVTTFNGYDRTLRRLSGALSPPPEQDTASETSLEPGSETPR